MRQIKLGMETTIPSALLEVKQIISWRCHKNLIFLEILHSNNTLKVWEMTRFAKEIGIPANLDSNLLLEEAAHLASKLGHGFVQTHKEKVEQV